MSCNAGFVCISCSFAIWVSTCPVQASILPRKWRLTPIISRNLSLNTIQNLMNIEYCWWIFHPKLWWRSGIALLEVVGCWFSQIPFFPMISQVWFFSEFQCIFANTQVPSGFVAIFSGCIMWYPVQFNATICLFISPDPLCGLICMAIFSVPSYLHQRYF